MLNSSVDPDSHSFVFYMMEPMKPVVDRVVIKLVSEETFSGDGLYLAKERGGLSSELARKVVHEVNLELRAAR